MTARIALAATKRRRPISAHRRGRCLSASTFLSAMVVFCQCALADESGVSFWVPGFFGSLAATPQQPGWSLANIYYHPFVKAGADVAFARQVTRGNITVP